MLTDESGIVEGVGIGCCCGGGHLHVMFGTSLVKAQGYETCQLIIMKMVLCTV